VATTRDLRAAAAAIHSAVAADDADALHEALVRLRRQIVERTRAGAELDRLPGALPTVVRGGQERLLAMIDDLLFVDDDGTGRCPCLDRAADLEVRVRRQARLEATALPAARRRQAAGRLRSAG
jgi:hypothetical protein